MHLICWDQSDLMAVQKKWVLSRHSDIMFWCCTDAQRIRCAVRKRYKQLHSYLSSLCQSPSNRSRNRYRGGSGSTSFSSSTMVPLLKTQRQRQIPPQTAPPQLGGDLLQNQLSSSSFCYSKHKSVTNTLIHLMVPYSSFFRKKEKTSLFSATRHNAALLFFTLRQQVEDVHPSVGRGGSTFLWQLESNWLSLFNTSILPAWAPHGRTDCKCVKKRRGEAVATFPPSP